MISEREQDKQKILDLVREYAKKYLSNYDIKKYLENDRIPYSAKIFDEEEVCNLVDSSLEFWLTQGRYYDEFENKLSKFLNVKNVCFVNSGSSANLLAFSALTSPLLKDRKLNVGDEVITVACGFPTTIAPILQLGMVPVFIDVDIPTYNVNVDELQNALSNKTKAVFFAHTLGNPFNIKVVKEFCEKNSLWLIEDNCDALGAKVKIDNEYKYTGTIGDIGTSSFYPPHHMTTGEGGATYTNNNLLYKIMLSMRDWGRDCVCKSGIDNTCKHRYDGEYGLLPKGYDHKYVYSHFGYNLKATDLQASIGVIQIEKLNSFIEKRINNFNTMYELFKNMGLEEYFILPKATKDTIPSWFAFILTCKDNVDRKKVVSYMENKNIQTRMLFAGNIIKQPCFDSIRNEEAYKVKSSLKNTDIIMNNTFLLGVYPGIDEDRIKYMGRSLLESVL